ncbi:MAG: hypothetical protein ACO3UU_08420 [Minisyncoccia bacterium]
MKTSIEIYKITDFKTSGGLKKRAVPLYKIESSEDLEYKSIAREIIQAGYSNFRRGYVFTSINAKSSEGEEVIIWQTLHRNNTEIMESPLKLWDALLAIN